MRKKQTSKFNSDINSKSYYGCVLDCAESDERLEKFQQQRLKKGFDETETWSLRSYYH